MVDKAYYEDSKKHTLDQYKKRLKRFDANECIRMAPEAMRLRRCIAEMEKALAPKPVAKVSKKKVKPIKEYDDNAGETPTGE